MAQAQDVAEVAVLCEPGHGFSAVMLLAEKLVESVNLWFDYDFHGHSGASINYC